MGVERVEQHRDQPRLRELLPVQPDRRGVGHAVLEAQPQEAHERQPVADLILDLIVGEVVERLQNQRLDHDDLVPGLAPGGALALLVRLAPHRAHLRAEALPGHHLVQNDQRVVLGIEAPIALIKVGKAQLTHPLPPLRTEPPDHESHLPGQGKARFFEAPLSTAITLR